MNVSHKPLCLLLLAVLNLSTLTVVTAREVTSNPSASIDTEIDYAKFKEPPRRYWGHAWFTFNLGALNDESVLAMVRKAAESDSYGGFMITPSPGRGWGRTGHRKQCQLSQR